MINKLKTPLSTHILPTAATMVGVCMTVISIVKLLGNVNTWVDEILAIDSLVFLASAFFSYLSIRQNSHGERMESWADATFMWGLLLMSTAAITLTFELV